MKTDVLTKLLAPFRGGGIRRRLLIWGLSLFGIALSIVVFAGYYYMVWQIRQDAAALQSELARVTSEQIRTFVRRKIERFSDNASALSLYQLGEKEQQLLLGLLVKNDSSFTHASIINSEGMEVLKVSDRKVYFPSDLIDQSKSPKFLKALKGESFVSPVYTSSQGQPYVTLAIPLWGVAQSVAGVVSAEADLSFLWEALGKIQFGTAGYAYLVDGQGKLIAHKDPRLVLQQISLGDIDGVKNFLRNPTLADKTPAHEGVGLTGKPVLVTYAPVPELGWAVILEEPVEAALANVELLKRYALLFLVTGLFIGAAIIVWVSRKITRPIQTLRQDATIIGAGDLEHRTNVTTGDEIEELANEFNKMTIALQNSYATLEQKVAQRTKEISALYSVTTALNESLALNDILNAIIAKTIEIFRFESIRVFLFNDERDALELRASFATNPQHQTTVQLIKSGNGVMGHVTQTGEPMIFEDVQTDPRYAELSTSRAAVNANLRFFAVMPIKTQTRVFGAILFSAHNPRKLAQDETRLLTAMSEHLAVAVEKASLFRESEKRAQQLSLLNSIGEAVNQSLNLDMVLNTAVNKMTEVLNFDASWIYMMDPSAAIFELKAQRGIKANTVRDLDRKEILSGATEMIFHSGERLVFEDLHNQSRKTERSDQSAIPDVSFASTAVFPIKAKDKVIGVLHLASKAKHHFAVDELKLIESITQEIGVAADNARLFEQVHSQTEELSKTNKELDQANQAKSEFISAMSHELRTPLNVIMGNAELTGDGFWGPINDEQKNSMEKIRHHSRFLLKLVNDVLALSRLDAKKMSLELSTVDIDEVVAHVQSHVEQLNRSKRLEVNWDVDADLPPITTDETKLEEILQNLIGNAFKFTPRGQINLRVKNLREQRRIEFCIADSGIGIEPQDMERIFTAFEQIREAHTGEFNGVGLGLSIVKNYLNLMNGDIRVESRPGEGSTFIFTVPHSVPVPS